MSKHLHVYRAVPGAGWKCILCGRWTVTPPPKEQLAAWRERTPARSCPKHPHWSGVETDCQFCQEEGTNDR